VDLDNALRMYTINAAYAAHEEAIKGSVEVGKLADIVVLNGDIVSAEPEELPEMQVFMTMVDGQVAYQA
jgi:hypothetical protein